MIQHYEPDYIFSDRETFYLEGGKEYIDLYRKSSGIMLIHYHDMLLFQFRKMKAHVQGYFEKEQEFDNFISDELIQNIYSWGGEQVELAQIPPFNGSTSRIGVYVLLQNVNDFDFEARKIVDKIIQEDYPFGEALYDVVQVDAPKNILSEW